MSKQKYTTILFVASLVLIISSVYFSLQIDTKTVNASTPSSQICETLDPDCATDPVDGCDVRSDVFGFPGGNMPMGIDICADNVTFDCDGNTLQGDETQYTVWKHGIETFGHDNITISNCKIKGYYNGIQAVSTIDSNITANTFTNNFVAMWGLDGFDNNVISSNTVDMSAPFLLSPANYRGFQLSSSSYNIVENNIFTGTTDPNASLIFGVMLTNVASTSISDNIFIRSGIAISAQGTARETLINDNWFRLNANGITMAAGDFRDSIISNNDIQKSDNEGIAIPNSNGAIRLDDNISCFSGLYDIDSQFSTVSSGDNNTCDTTRDWDDDGTIGCTYACQAIPTLEPSATPPVDE